MSDEIVTALNNEAERIRAARQIGQLLRQGFEWHDNYVNPSLARTVHTNIGLFSFVGIRQPVEAAEIADDVVITLPKPHSKCVIGVTHLPTSPQKIIILNDLVHRLARALGSSADSLVEIDDPTKTGGGLATRKIVAAGRDQHDMAERASALVGLADYAKITRPYVITIRWPVGLDGEAK